jgi:magnesium-transporting ATPase (P-type)
MLYNSLWTSFTCFFAYSLERDIPIEESLNAPKLYEAGQKREYFSYLKFWKWIVLSIFHGFVVYFGCTYGFRGIIESNGRTDGLWYASTTAFTCVIHLVTGKLVIELLFLNWIVIAAGIGSLL